VCRCSSRRRVPAWRPGYGVKVRGSMAETIQLAVGHLNYSGQRTRRRTTLSAWSRSASTAEKSSSRCPNLESCRCGCCSANAGTPRSSLFGRCSTGQPAVALSHGCQAFRRRASCHPRPARAPRTRTRSMKMKTAQFFKLRRCMRGGLSPANPTLRHPGGREVSRLGVPLQFNCTRTPFRVKY